MGRRDGFDTRSQPSLQSQNEYRMCSPINLSTTRYDTSLWNYSQYEWCLIINCTSLWYHVLQFYDPKFHSCSLFPVLYLQRPLRSVGTRVHRSSFRRCFCENKRSVLYREVFSNIRQSLALLHVSPRFGTCSQRTGDGRSAQARHWTSSRRHK